jgi:hypothetical protein
MGSLDAEQQGQCGRKQPSQNRERKRLVLKMQTGKRPLQIAPLK